MIIYIKNNYINIDKYPIIFIIGPTASGKTKLIIKLKQLYPILDIISVDSVSIYKNMNIGTSKPSKNELLIAPHRLINIKEITEEYSAFNFYKDCIKEINNIINNKKIPILVGGSMFYFYYLLNCNINNKYKYIDKYINSIINKYGYKYIYYFLSKKDSKFISIVNINDLYRIKRYFQIYLYKNMLFIKNENNFFSKKFNIYIFSVFKDKYKAYKNIKIRFNKMISQGLELEVLNIIKKNNLDYNSKSMKSIGYKQMLLYINNKLSYIDMINNSINSTKKLFKNQLLWLKKFNSDYIDIDNINNINYLINKLNMIINSYKL